MSKGKIINLCALAVIVIFLIAIYFLPPLKQAFIEIFCIPEIMLLKTRVCTTGPLLLYMVPLVAIAIILMRFSAKIIQNLG